MKKTILLTAFVAVAALGVNAQSTTPQTANNQTTTNGKTTTQAQASNPANRPYSDLANYNTMDATTVPQNVRSTFGSSYEGVTETKWQGNGKDYRTSFKSNGKDMSVVYDENGEEREVRTGMQVTDLPMSVQTQLKGQEATMPYEVRVGNETYYSAQVKGKEIYYDGKGKKMKMPKANKPR